MAKFCDVQKFKEAYEHRVGTQFDNAIYEMERDEFCKDVVPVTEGATNGDMIKAMFPNIESRLDEKTGIILVKWTDGTTKTFKASWWNALYKEEVAK